MMNDPAQTVRNHASFPAMAGVCQMFKWLLEMLDETPLLTRFDYSVKVDS